MSKSMITKNINRKGVLFFATMLDLIILPSLFKDKVILKPLQKFVWLSLQTHEEDRVPI